MSYKFDEAAFSNDNGNAFEMILLEKINEELKTDISNIANYKGNLFCPECHKPQLSIVLNHKTNDYFFRTYPNQYHFETCSYSFESINIKIFNTFLDEKNNSSFVNNKLHNVIDRLLKKRKLELNPFIVRVDNDRVMLENISETLKQNRCNIYRIPTKSITAPFSDDDYGNYKIFYGNVDVSLCQRKNKMSNESFYSLQLYRKKTDIILCSLSMSNSVCSFLKQKYNFELNRRLENIYIAFATRIVVNNTYKNGKITHSDYCVIDTE